MTTLSQKEFKNDFVQQFKGDESGDITPRQTPGVLYSRATPTPVPNPELLAWSEELAQELGISNPGEEDIAILAGNKITGSMYPYAANYAGHQFGNWAGQLGDGRAITLGEWNANGSTYELQLKGAGLTPYSRRADGRAVLRSSVREYLISEAMHHLGIPTTRALSLVSTGEEVLRDMFYNGNAKYEPGAIVMRVSESFLRFGSFELLAVRKDREQLQQLVDWTINHHYPHIKGEDRILNWYREVVERTAALMVEWQRVGFVHGVMNTDNMSILGQTIDYGPFSFLDNYDHNFTPNTTDLPGRRYAFGNQPSIGYWNLGRLANALALLFEETEGLEEALNSYEEVFWNKYYAMMGKKLGLDKVTGEDKTLITAFEKNLSLLQPDMSIFYRLLIHMPSEPEDDEKIIQHFQPCFYEEPAGEQKADFLQMIRTYSVRLTKNSISREVSREIMKKNNPRIILRNYLLHQAIEELEEGKDTLFRKLQEAMKQPYSPEGFEDLVKKRPDWASQKAGCSMLSCSS